MKTCILTLALVLCLQQSKQKRETLFGVTYTIKYYDQTLKDNGVRYFYKGYYLKGKPVFAISLKGVRNDSTVMVAKTIILKDKIINTDVYKKGSVHEDSTVITLHFKNGVYIKASYQDFEDGKIRYNSDDLFQH